MTRRRQQTANQDVIDALQHPHREIRLQAARALGELLQGGKLTRQPTEEVNNHVHTTYSFSPYEPAMAVFQAWKAGLQIVGSADHDSIAAADETAAAAAYIGIASTTGFELRTSFKDTPLADRKINSPDAVGAAYVVVHGVPASRREACSEFLAPVQKARNARSRRQVKALNACIKETGLGKIDFKEDVYALSHADEGGSITERHLLSALARRIVSRYGRGANVVARLEQKFGLKLKGGSRKYLMDPGNPHYLYDLLGVLKASLLPKFYIEPEAAEIIPVDKVIAFADSIGAVAAYPYLGDVNESPTGDKQAEAFEDSYLEELFDVLTSLGFPAVTYMPPRNTKEQLLRVQQLAARHGMMEISGVDINSSRQSFRCPELLEPEFRHLIDSAWALVAHERLSNVRPELGLFSRENPAADLPLDERIRLWSAAAKRTDPRNPEGIFDYLEGAMK